MPEERDIKLDGFGIGRRASRELRNLCEQYPFYGQPRGSTLKSMIEQSAREADPEQYPEFLKAVTANLPYEKTSVLRGFNQFYTRRRKFFHILAQKYGIVR